MLTFDMLIVLTVEINLLAFQAKVHRGSLPIGTFELENIHS